MYINKPYYQQGAQQISHIQITEEYFSMFQLFLIAIFREH